MSIKKILNKNIDFSKIEKKYVLLFLSIILFILIILKIAPLKNIFIDKNIKAEIKKNKVNITGLYMDREIAYENDYFINTIDFENGKELIHTRLGNLGFSDNFFIDFHTKFEVLKDETFNFIVSSDDGFNLKINNELQMEYTESRPIASNQCKIFLKQGIYDLKISYFQGFGLLGLKAYYECTSTGKKYFIGENSGFIRFIKP